MFDFDNRFVRELPGDSGDPRMRARSRAHCGRAWIPRRSPRRACSRIRAKWRTALGLDEADVASPEFAQVFGGNALLPGMQPYAASYGGHQFGHWAGQLGDGRAITLGEVVNAAGERWELQLKGAGPDAVLAHAPTAARCCARRCASSCAARRCTTSACRPRARCAWSPPASRWCATCSTTAIPKAEPGAIVCRVAPSFMRFGNFELPASRGDVDAAAAAGRLQHPPRFPGAARARARRCTATGSRRSASAPR